MPTAWPTDDGGIFDLVAADLAPLAEAYEGGELLIPDGLEDILEAPVSNGTTSILPWQFVASASVSQRGTDVGRRIVILGVTTVQGDGESAQFRRFVDWAGVWAQLGVSDGRGEFDDQQQHFLLPDGRETDPLV